MMNQQLANQINAATSAKQAQLRAIQAGLVNKNKTKPVSTVEPFQRSLTTQLVDNHHVSAEDLKPPTIEVMENKNDNKYQTLPFNTKFSNNANNNNNGNANSNAKAAKIEQLKQEKENNNVGFSEALPRPPPPVSYGGQRAAEYQANYVQGIGVVAPLPQTDNAITSANAISSAAAVSSISKPVSSVAPVFANQNVYIPPTSSISGGSAASSSSTDNDSPPPKVRPALPPKPLVSGGIGEGSSGGGGGGGQVHGDEGTSVDDEDLPPPPPTSEPPSDSPTPDNSGDNMYNSNNGSSRGDLSVAVSQTASYEPSSGLMVSTATASDSQAVHVSINRRIEMPPAFHFPEGEAPPSDLVSGVEYPPMLPRDVTDNAAMFPMVNQIYKEFQDLGFEEKEQLFSRSPDESDEYTPESVPEFEADPVTSAESKGVKSIIENLKKGHVKVTGKTRHNRKVTFDPLALLLDASLEGELDLVKKTATEVPDPSAANDEGITALHNAICAGHLDIVKFLVLFGCDVNAQDSDGWTPLHCAASCNNLAMVRFLVEHGACIFATTLSDHETAAEKCEEDEEGFDGCSEYLYSE